MARPCPVPPSGGPPGPLLELQEANDLVEGLRCHPVENESENGQSNEDPGWSDAKQQTHHDDQEDAPPG